MPRWPTHSAPTSPTRGSGIRHRDALSGLFTEWFSQHSAEEITAALSATSVLWERYRTFAEAATDDRVTANPMFSPLDQPRIGQYLAPGLPIAIDGALPARRRRTGARRRHRRGARRVARDDPDEIGRLTESGTVA